MSREKRHAWTALIVALSLLAVGPPQHRARAAVPTATEGLIAFVRDGGPPESGIYTITPSGSGLLRLTDGEDYRPRWSPDGSKIVFQRFEAGSAQSYIFAMNADGTNLQHLSTRRGFQPAWSPDGARIVFGSGSRHRADLGAGRVWAQGGVTWGELDRETQVFGLATTGGEVSTTGIAGFTLGGGLGVLMRAYGLACDNLRSIKIVTSDGAVRTASRHENADLFWAARGGGRGLGVVTSFEFDLHPLGPEVAAAQVLYRFEEAPRVVRAFRNTALESPDEVAPELFLWSVPADPEIPQELHGSPVVYVGAVYAGPADEAEATLAPLRSLGPPLLDTTGLFPYVELQSGADEAFPVGGRYYMKSHFLDELSDAGIDTLLEWYAQRPTAETLIAIRTLGGAVARVGDAESAFAHRSARFNLSIDATWVDPSMDEVAIGWARSTWQEMRAFSNGGVYLNFSGLDAEAEDLRGAVQGSNELRLAEIRDAYDPQGVFAAAAGRP